MAISWPRARVGSSLGIHFYRNWKKYTKKGKQELLPSVLALGPLVPHRSLIYLPCLGGITWPNVEKGLKNSHVSETFIFPGAPAYKCHIIAPSDHCKHLMDGLGEEDGVGAGGGALGQSQHRHYTHGVGDARARAPPGQHKANISLLQEALGLDNIQGQVHSEVHILSPGLLHWVLTYHRDDAMVQVCLVSCLMIPCHSNDGGTEARGSTWPPGELTCQTPSEPSKLHNWTWSAATANSQTHEKEIMDNGNAVQKLTNCTFQNRSESYTITWVTKGKIPEPST